MFSLVRSPLARLIPFMPLIGKKIRIAYALFLLGAGVSFWVATEAIAPQAVQAYTARVNLALDRLPEESYETLLRRAEAAARAATQRSFDRDLLVTDVSIIVSAQNYGAIAPILTIEVSRSQWRKRPDPQRWATYFKSSRILLFGTDNFMAVPQPPTNATSPVPPPTPPSQ